VIKNQNGQDVVYYARDKIYRGLVRYESSAYETKGDASDADDPGELMVCTRSFIPELGHDPEFVPLTTFLYGSSSDCLTGAAPGAISPGKCVVYSADGAVDSEGMNVIYGGSQTFSVSPNGDVKVGDGTFSVNATDGSAVVAGGLSASNGRLDVSGATGDIVSSGNLQVKGRTILESLQVDSPAHMHSLEVVGEVRATQFVAVSDRRRKENICILSPKLALQKIQQLRPCVYTMNGREHSGLIAQEVQEVLPFCVVEDDAGGLGVNYTDVLGYLLAAVREIASATDPCK
jgi:hypothetical protein